jgi:hypothetical protein
MYKATLICIVYIIAARPLTKEKQKEEIRSDRTISTIPTTGRKKKKKM